MRYISFVLLAAVLVLSGCLGAAKDTYIEACPNNDDVCEAPDVGIVYVEAGKCKTSTGFSCETHSDCPKSEDMYYRCREDAFGTKVCVAYTEEQNVEIKCCGKSSDCDDGNSATEDICAHPGSAISACYHLASQRRKFFKPKLRQRSMVSVFDVDAGKLVEKLATKLEKDIEMPKWAEFVKTGAHKERPPVQKTWWYIRAAAILRTIYKDGPVGISKLRSKYGGAKNRGRKKHRFTKGSGKVIRTIVQQLEEKGYLKRAEKGKGRLVTSQGQSLLEKTASEVYTKKAKAEISKSISSVAVSKAKVEKVETKKEPEKKVVEKSEEVPKPKVEEAKKDVKKALPKKETETPEKTSKSSKTASKASSKKKETKSKKK